MYTDDDKDNNRDENGSGEFEEALYYIVNKKQNTSIPLVAATLCFPVFHDETFCFLLSKLLFGARRNFGEKYRFLENFEEEAA